MAEHTEVPPEVRREERVSAGLIASGSSVEAIAGVLAVVVAVIGLAGYRPLVMAGTATILVGVALLAQGGALATRWSKFHDRVPQERNEVISGVRTELFAGGAGIVLGVLALARVDPFILLAVAAISFGVALLLGGPVQPAIAELVPERATPGPRVSREVVETSGGVMVLVGIAAAVIGILALMHVAPVVPLCLVALLVLGTGVVFAGSTMAARLGLRFA
jgi:hypothetical protein